MTLKWCFVHWGREMNSYSLKHLEKSQEFSLQDSSSLIGRSQNCDIQIEHDSLSREHARIVLKGDDISVQDLHSTNGTFVNERQIFETTNLSPGDVLRFGQESFCVQLGGTEATIAYDQNALAHLNSASSMLVEDEEAGGTMMLQSIALPAGWQHSSILSAIESELTDKDKALIEALRSHAIKKLHHKHGLLVTILPEQKTPAVKLLSSNQEHARWSIGRAKKQALQLDDPRVSEQHAFIHFEKTHWRFEDNDSRNGSFQGAKKIHKTEIAATTAVSLGPFLLKFEPITK